MSGHLITNEDVDVLDSWNEANGSIPVTVTNSESSSVTTDLTYINVDEYHDDYYDDYYDNSSIQFEFGSISDWDEDDDWSDYSELKIECELDSCNDTTCTDCSGWYESNFDTDDDYTDSMWMSNIEISFTWDPTTFTFTFTDNFSYAGYDGIVISIPSGATISAETREFISGVPNLVVEDTETADPWENAYLSFNEDGTITDDYSVDCSQIPAEDDWDCYGEGCGAIMSGNDVIGCENIDCSSFDNMYECWENNPPCYWNYNDGCENEDDGDEGPGGMTWEIVDDQMVISAGEDYDFDDDMMPVQIFDIAYDGDNLILTQTLDMCDYYMTHLYYSYEYYFGFPWGTGPYADYYSEYFDNFCIYLYDDLANDIYGLDGDQVESAIQTQAITLVPSEWSPSMRSNHRAQRTNNPLIKPKLLKKPN